MLNLSELDPLPTKLYLPIRQATKTFKGAVRFHDGSISSSIYSSIRGIDEDGGSLLRSIDVTSSELKASHRQFSSLTLSYKIEVLALICGLRRFNYKARHCVKGYSNIAWGGIV
jgi:hypothetical protein